MSYAFFGTIWVSDLFLTAWHMWEMKMVVTILGFHILQNPTILAHSCYTILLEKKTLSTASLWLYPRQPQFATLNYLHFLPVCWDLLKLFEIMSTVQYYLTLSHIDGSLLKKITRNHVTHKKYRYSTHITCLTMSPA